ARGVAEGRDPEYLHQLRVGTRRLRSALRAFRPLLKRRRAAGVEQPFENMMRIFGEARDWDVFCEALAEGEAPPGLLGAARRRRAGQRRPSSARARAHRFARERLARVRAEAAVLASAASDARSTLNTSAFGQRRPNRPKRRCTAACASPTSHTSTPTGV